MMSHFPGANEPEANVRTAEKVKRRRKPRSQGERRGKRKLKPECRQAADRSATPEDGEVHHRHRGADGVRFRPAEGDL